jgi:hypothetical protein
MQKWNFAMTHLANGTVATDIDAIEDNAILTAQGYSIRHIETWHEADHTCIVWDSPQIGEADLPY